MHSIEGNDSRSILLVGSADSTDEALRQALGHHGLVVRTMPPALDLREVFATAPDLIVLTGEAATGGGERAMQELARSPRTAVMPVALLADHEDSEQRLSAFRNGAVAVVVSLSSVDATARRLAELARDMFHRPPPAAADEPAEAVSFDKSAAAAAQLLLPDRIDGPIEQMLVFHDLRIMLALRDGKTAQALARALGEHGAAVVTTDANVQNLELVRSLDPSVVIVDANTITDRATDVIARLQNDARLQWTPAVGILPGDVMADSGRPDLARLARLLSPVVEQERILRERVLREQQFDTRLEETGPFKLLRALTAGDAMLHATVCHPRLVADIDTVSGLVVAASATPPGPTRHLEGISALARLLDLEEGRVRIERRAHPSTVNIMLPLEEALAAAAEQLLPIAAGTGSEVHDERPPYASEMPAFSLGEEEATDSIRTTILARPGAPRCDEQSPMPIVAGLEEHREPPTVAPAPRSYFRRAAVVAAIGAAGLVIAASFWDESHRSQRSPGDILPVTHADLDEPLETQPYATRSEAPAGDIRPEEPLPAGTGQVANGSSALPVPVEESRSEGNVADARFHDLLDSAIRLRRESRWAQAEGAYLEILEQRPGSFPATAGLARLHLKRGDASSAVLWAKRSLEIRPSSPALRVLLGDAQALAGDRASAEESWRQALRANPNDAAARKRLAEARN